MSITERWCGGENSALGTVAASSPSGPISMAPVTVRYFLRARGVLEFGRHPLPERVATGEKGPVAGLVPVTRSHPAFADPG
jgi:hypothetical protein